MYLQNAQKAKLFSSVRIVPPLKPVDASKDKDDTGEVATESDNTDKPLLLCLNFNYERMYTPPLYCLSQIDISRDLARLHPEFTIAMLSGICMVMLSNGEVAAVV